MLKKNFLSGSAGSTPLELASLVVVLLMPLAPMLALYGEIFDAIAAESIARHSLRAAVLKSSVTPLDNAIADSVRALASSWQREAKVQFDCGKCEKGDLIVIEIKVGNSTAIQVAGLEPN